MSETSASQSLCWRGPSGWEPTSQMSAVLQHSHSAHSPHGGPRLPEVSHLVTDRLLYCYRSTDAATPKYILLVFQAIFHFWVNSKTICTICTQFVSSPSPQHHSAAKPWDPKKLCCSPWILHWRCGWVSAFRCAVRCTLVWFISNKNPLNRSSSMFFACFISSSTWSSLLLPGILPRFCMNHVSRISSPFWWCSSAARITSGTLTLSPSWWRCYSSPTLLSSLVLSDSLKWWRTTRCLSNSWSPPSWSSTPVGSPFVCKKTEWSLVYIFK